MATLSVKIKSFDHVYHLEINARSDRQANAGEANSSITRYLIEGKYGLAIYFPSSCSFSATPRQSKAKSLLLTLSHQMR